VPQILTSIDIMEKMTPADIQALARQYLRPELAWKAEVLPDKTVAVPVKKAEATSEKPEKTRTN
jgi:hypothetical protein